MIRTVGIIQARMGSTRLPGKVLMNLSGQPMLAFMLERIRRSKSLDDIWVATTVLEQDDPIAALCTRLSVPVFRGSEDDVLQRFHLAAEAARADVVVRLTADCPLICPEISDRVVRAFHEAEPSVDYASNTLKRTFPRGLDSEVMARRVLDVAAREAIASPDREHVTYFVWRQPGRFRLLGLQDVEDNSRWRWTVDTPKDFSFVSTIVSVLGAEAVRADYAELNALCKSHPEWSDINASEEQKI